MRRPRPSLRPPPPLRAAAQLDEVMPLRNGCPWPAVRAAAADEALEICRHHPELHAHAPGLCSHIVSRLTHDSPFRDGTGPYTPAPWVATAVLIGAPRPCRHAGTAGRQPSSSGRRSIGTVENGPRAAR